MDSSPPRGTSAPQLRDLWFLPIPFLFFLATTAPGIGHADQALFIHEMRIGALHSGASYHNLTVLTGHLFFGLLPFEDPAYRCNLVSTVYGALAVGLFYLVALQRTGRVPVAACGAALFMTSHSLWWHSTIAEAYAANAFLFVGTLGALERFDATGRPRWLDLGCFLAALGTFNHAQMGMWLPGIALAALLALVGHGRTRSPIRMGLAYALGLVPFGLAVLSDILRTGALAATAREAGGGQWTKLFFTFNTLQLVDSLRLFAMQWGWPSVVPILFLVGAPVFARSLRTSCASVAALVAILVNTAFFLGYPTWDKYAFLLPTFLLVTWVAVLGLDVVWTACGERRTWKQLLAGAALVSAAWPIAFFADLPTRAATSDFWSRYRIDPFRRRTMTDGAYLSNPNKAGYRGVEHFARLLLQRLPPGALVIDHIAQTFYQFLHYYQGELHERPDLVFRAWVPPLFDPAEWIGGLDTTHVVAAVAEAIDGPGAFATSLAEPGFNETVTRLMDRGIVFVEFPLGTGETMFEARHARDVDFRKWVDAAVPAPGTAGSVAVRWTAHNPPLLAAVTWTDAAGTIVPGEAFRMPFDAPPTRFSPPRPLARGRWSAVVRAFGQDLASTAVDVSAPPPRP